MKLLVDIGNSSVKWASLKQAKLGDVGSTGHQGSLPADAFSAWQRLGKPSELVVANVAGPEMMLELKLWAREQWGLDANAPVSVAVGYGVRNAYANAEKLGVDRWAALLAARRCFAGHPCCVVDCGTALTIDALDAEGQHLGGLIVPGLTMMRQALVGKTAGIELSGSFLDKEPSLLACNTEEAVLKGTLNAMAATINKVVKELEVAVKGELGCLLSGGDGQVMLPLLSSDFVYDDVLVLRGLAIISGDIK